ncbi:MAG: lamin tail domain-containing protein, partial [Verrucomicrobiota bacterium]
GAVVTAVAPGDTTRRLNLAVSGLAYGTTYTLTLTGVRDRSVAGNTVAPNTLVRFAASELAPASLAGAGALSTQITRIGPGDFDLLHAGGDVGGTADSAGIGWQTVSGNFDLRVRVDQFRVADPYATAGLLARVDLTPGGVFAGVFASSPRAGVFFESRASAGAAATVQSLRGGYPVNPPHTWLRLRRVANVLTGFGSLDGTRWTQLGTVTLTLPAPLQVGLSVAGRDPSLATVARFRSFGPATGAVTGPLVQTREGLGVSSRRTRIVFSEIHYHPAASGAGALPPFIELFNAGDVFEDLSGWTLAGGAVQYRFPDGFRLAAGQFAVVSASPAALQAATGLTGVLGPYTGTFPATGGRLELRDELEALKLAVEFSDDPPWPVAADGAG